MVGWIVNTVFEEDKRVHLYWDGKYKKGAGGRHFLWAKIVAIIIGNGPGE